MQCAHSARSREHASTWIHYSYSDKQDDPRNYTKRPNLFFDTFVYFEDRIFSGRKSRLAVQSTAVWLNTPATS
jgi:hypothetical protein